MEKACIACAQVKPLEQFYRHPKMSDGHINRCIECHKAAVKNRRRLNPAVQAYDRERAKRPARREQSISNGRRWRTDHPEAYAAQTAVGNALRDGKLTRLPCMFCKATEHVHAHHRDYSKPLDVIWLCAKCHHRLHANFPETEGHHRDAA